MVYCPLWQKIARTPMLLLKVVWSETKESFVKNQYAALYKIGHILKRLLIRGGGRSGLVRNLQIHVFFAMATER